MNRMLRIIAVFVFITVAGVVLWMARTRKPSPQASIKDTVHSVMTNPVSFAKNRFTGGVGAALTVDKTSGNLLIMQVMPGSQAEVAGLLAGDHILQVDGVATSGRTLAQNVESIRRLVVNLPSLRRAGTDAPYREENCHSAFRDRSLSPRPSSLGRGNPEGVRGSLAWFLHGAYQPAPLVFVRMRQRYMSAVT